MNDDATYFEDGEDETPELIDMDIFWDGDKDRPEGAIDYSFGALLSAHRKNKAKTVVVGNPGAAFAGRKIASRGSFTEVHTAHDQRSLEPNFWANATIRGTVGLLTGFGTVRSLELVSAIRSNDFKLVDREHHITVINGPNLNLLGVRQPEIYGTKTLKNIYEELVTLAPQVEIQFMQSNNEGDLVTAIQQARDASDAIIINAGAYTHTSVAIHDALQSFDDVKIELHISNPHQREAFRHRSFVGPAVDHVMAGFGPEGYKLALMAALRKL